ncbi:CBS domain-containing protein [Roseococcus sp. YIM B11640]|uniref:CBS domain-containing protein n=1 Tax=Roseococcus sp. YIM B11640 TaxID=3133973 RepID=UPI003C7D08E1
MTRETLTAADLMTSPAVTVPPAMPVTALARLLAERRISAAPVTDAEGSLLGIVTEADLLRRVAAEKDAPRSWLSRLLGDADAQARAYARTHGQQARDIMTTDVVTVAPGESAAHCAKQMEERGIKRLPVVTPGGKLLGVLSRADVLLAAMEPPHLIGTPAEDRDRRIRATLRKEMKDQPWVDRIYAAPEVKDGVVILHGFVRSEDARRALQVMASRIEGVERVEDQMEVTPLFMVGSYI